MNVFLYDAEHNLEGYTDQVVRAFTGQHDLRVYDEGSSFTDQLKNVDVVVDVGGWGPREMIEAAVDAKMWQILGQGLDHTDVALIKSMGIMVCNCPGQISAVPLAECAMMHILMLARKFHESTARLKKGRMHEPVGQSLAGLTLALIGFGATAQELTKRAKSFGMRIEAIDIRKVDSGIKPDFMGSTDDLDEVIGRCDFLSLHLHLTDQTRQIIDARRLALMKSTAFLINVARGGLVDEQALHSSVLQGQIAGVGLDVYPQEPPDISLGFFNQPNVTLTPHIGGSTDYVVRERAEVALENTNRLAQGLEPLYRVDNETRKND